MADDSERPLPGRSLIPVAPHRSLPRSCRPAANNATFLAQLIATKQKLPQTRERRRADPADANAAYGAVEQASGGVVTGRAISRIA